MFTKSDIATVDTSYFYPIELNAGCIIVQSRNTKHYWMIQSNGDKYKTVRLYHKHHLTDTWHNQSFYGVKRHDIGGAFIAIKQHDRFVLRTR